jgi:hypothetical protein
VTVAESDPGTATATTTGTDLETQGVISRTTYSVPEGSTVYAFPVGGSETLVCGTLAIEDDTRAGDTPLVQPSTGMVYGWTVEPGTYMRIDTVSVREQCIWVTPAASHPMLRVLGFLVGADTSATVEPA